MTIEQIGSLIAVIASTYIGTSVLGSEKLKAALVLAWSKISSIATPGRTDTTPDIDDEGSHTCAKKLIDVATALRKAGDYELAKSVDALLGPINEALSMSKLKKPEATK